MEAAEVADAAVQLQQLLSQWPQLLQLAWTPVVLLLAAGVYFLFVRKMDYSCSLEDAGYIQSDGFSKQQSANRVRRLRRIGGVPPVYPNGWYLVMDSSQLRPLQAESVHIIGQTLAVFRDAGGTAHILDAHCPHFGANLAAGGRVKGDCIECPFHGWQFRGSDGQCASIPALAPGAKIPDSAKVRSHISREVNGGIYLWFHAEGAEPQWQLPAIDGIEDGSWCCKGRTRHFVNCHIEEINQNGADIAHLTVVHDPSFFSGTDLRFIFRRWSSFLWQQFTASWSAGTEDGDRHRAVMELNVKTFLFGWNLSFVGMTVRANQLGPAVVYLHFDSIFGPGVFVHCVTPVEPLLLRVQHSIHMRNWVPNIVPTVYLSGEAFQFERDIMIWNNKEYKDKPLLCKSKEDSFMLKHRRWYAQFYSENSPTLESERLKQDQSW